MLGRRNTGRATHVNYVNEEWHEYIGVLGNGYDIVHSARVMLNRKSNCDYVNSVEAASWK